MINVNQYNKDLERLRIILIEKNIISKDETKGLKMEPVKWTQKNIYL